MNASNALQPAARQPEEFPLSDAQFRRIRELVHEHTGIAIAESKRELVYGRLVRRIRRLALPGFDAYIGIVERGDAAELEEFTNAMTTNLTAFFREAHHFEFLASTVLPALLERNADTKRIRLWSAGCSTGEEPWSIAMTLAETLGNLQGWSVRLLATDLDSAVLAHAQAGRYDADRVEKVAAARRERFFVRNRDDGRYTVRDELRRYVAFGQLNLMHDWPMRGPFDVIFCRNVVIYFDRDTQRQLFGRMAALQRPGSHLFIGHSESLYRVSDAYELIGKTIHRRRP